MYSFTETFIVTTREFDSFGDEIFCHVTAFNTVAKARAHIKRMKAKGFSSRIEHVAGEQ